MEGFWRALDPGGSVLIGGFMQPRVQWLSVLLEGGAGSEEMVSGNVNWKSVFPSSVHAFPLLKSCCE